MPLIWHYRGKSDQAGIRKRMRVIPENLKQEVANKYECIFIQNNNGTGRKDANEFLDKIARQYKDVIEVVKPKLVNPRNAQSVKPNVASNKKPAQSKCGLWSKDI